MTIYENKYFGYESCTASYTKCNNLLVSISYKNVSISSNKLKLMYCDKICCIKIFPGGILSQIAKRKSNVWYISFKTHATLRKQFDFAHMIFCILFLCTYQCTPSCHKIAHSHHLLLKKREMQSISRSKHQQLLSIYYRTGGMKKMIANLSH